MVQCIVLHAQERGHVARPQRRQSQGQGDQRSRRPAACCPAWRSSPITTAPNLLNITTETVTENLCMGIVLVVVILFMFVSNIRTALIVAINIPLALLFAFSMLFLRGKSANLLSIGAVDFGIIVDSLRHHGREHLPQPGRGRTTPTCRIKERILRFVQEIDQALLFSTLIMVCAFVPLFTMPGPEGQLFGPMAQTYAFSLAGALVLALTLTPVLCMLSFKNLKPVRENFLVRSLKTRYLWQLKICLKLPLDDRADRDGLADRRHGMLAAAAGPRVHAGAGRGQLWIRGTGPLNITLERKVEIAKEARTIMATLPRGGVDRRPAGPARRRHRHRRLLQQRILRAAAAAEGLAATDRATTGWRAAGSMAPKRARTKDESSSTRHECRAGDARFPASTGTSRRTSATT